MLEIEKIRRIGELNLQDIIIDEKDLQSYMTGGIVVSATNLDLLRLKTVLAQIEDDGGLHGFKLVHFQITPDHLAVVKKEEWRRWKLERK